MGESQNSWDLLRKAIEIIVVVLFTVLILCVFSQVVFRYLLKISVPWTEEMARIINIWMVFIGLAAVEAYREQIRTVVLLEKLPARIRLILEGIFVVGASVYLISVLIGSWRMVQQTSNLSLGSIPWITSAIIYWASFLGIPLSILFMVRNWVIDWQERGGTK